MSKTDLPLRAPSTFPESDEHRSATVRGVLLAAGTSSRYGDENKLLQTVEGKSLVRHAAETLVASDVDGVTVVVGYEADRVRAAIDDLDVAIRTNDDYGAGQSTSVGTGIADAAERGADAALIALGDMPWVEVETVDYLVDGYRRGMSDILVAAHEGNRGNPVLFDSRFFDQLIDVDGDVGGRHLLLESGETVAIETSDPGVVRDIDCPTDLPE